MENLFQAFSGWQFKIPISALIALFYPFKLTIGILVIVIVLNITTEVIYDIKIKKLRISKFNNIILKVITYFIAIAAVRFFEASIVEIYSTTILTQFMISLLTLTEVINILKVLILLGVPIPSGFIKILVSYIKSKLLRDMLSENIKTQEYKDEIDNMINYQIPTLPSKDMQALVRIKCEEWSNTIDVINSSFPNEDESQDSTLLYYKLISIMNSTVALIDQKWEDSDVSREAIEILHRCHRQKLLKTFDQIKDICNSSDSIANKKSRVISLILLALYQTITDIQKCECKLPN